MNLGHRKREALPRRAARDPPLIWKVGLGCREPPEEKDAGPQGEG